MGTLIKDSKNSRIDIRDEREFKLWVKFIASVYKNGGDISKPSEILWKSVKDQIRMERIKYARK
jgi:hypothetical protein